jgi:hypothetical protein
MIYYFTPYRKGNLGQAYNIYCKLVPNNDDWITIMDGDVMQLHMDWGEKWKKILTENEDAGIITCVTNRVYNPKQLTTEKMFLETDIVKHREFAIKLFEEKKYTLEKLDNSLSGLFFSFKKSTWKKVNGFIDGILGVDDNFLNKVNKIKNCYVAKGFYVLHYYRLCEGNLYTKHLQD